jgi:hypothetical protein
MGQLGQARPRPPRQDHRSGPTSRAASWPNLARDTVAEVLAAAQQGVARVRREPALLFSFLQYCGLDL